MHTTILTVSDVRDIVRRVGLDALMDESIMRLGAAFAGFDPLKLVVPARDGFQYEAPNLGLIEWMPCMRAGETAHIKVVGYHPGNSSRHDLPTILSTLSMYGVQDGHLRGVMDATFITALRTGAASAVASRILAMENSSTLGLIGCGAQAVTQLHALSRAFHFDRVDIYDTDSEAMASFAQRVRCLNLDNIEIRPCKPQEILSSADILCTATSIGIGEGPVFDYGVFKQHLHVNAIGSDFPGKIELPTQFVRESVVCPDFPDQALKEGECQRLEPTDMGPDIHTLVKHQDDYLLHRKRATVFDSTGWAVEDMVCMDMFMEYAAEFGIGMELELESISSDTLNPYQFLFDSQPETVLHEAETNLLRAI